MDDILWGQGYEDADLMFIGDYARKADSTSGYCLSGYYKNKLAEYLNLVNFRIDQTYRTCIVKRYIQGLGVGNWSSDKKLLEFHYETAEGSLSEYINYLIEEINIIKPQVIICLGEYTLRILTGKEGIGKWRGSVLSFAPDILTRLTYPNATNTKLVFTYHPMITHTEEHQQYIIRMDVKKAVDMLYQPRPIDYHEIVICRNSVDLLRFIDQYPEKEFPYMSDDIETHYGFITCAGGSFDGYRGFTIPMWGAAKYDITDRSRMMYIHSQLLDSRKIIGQNYQYDRKIRARFGSKARYVHWDTMLAMNIIACEFPKRLDFLTSIYTDMSFYKDEGHDFDPRLHDIDQLYSYNCKDAIATFQVYEKQKKDLEELEQLRFFQDFIMKLFYLYYDCDMVGLLQDPRIKQELLGKYEGMYRIKLMELENITSSVVDGIDINKFVNSPTQIGKFIEAMNFPVLRHRVASGFMVVNTDVESFRKMKIADPADYRKCELGYTTALRFISLILLIRRIKKVIEYIEVGVHPDSRIRTSYQIAGTTSGRTSGRQTSDGFPIYGEDKKGKTILEFQPLGCSFQTVTKHGFIIEGEEDIDIEEGIIGNDIREMYRADKNHVLIEIDGSQAEARVCDVLGEDWNGLEDYKKFDKHSKVASMIYATVEETCYDCSGKGCEKCRSGKRNYTYEEIVKLAKKLHDPIGIEMRQIGKHAKHAKNNGLEAFQFATMYLHLPNFSDSVLLARRILRTIDIAYPNIEQVFHKQVEQTLRDTRCLVAPLTYGLPEPRKRMFFKKIDKHYINVAYSWIPQTTISDHNKAAALRIMDQVDRAKVFLVAENHDSLTFLCHYTNIRKLCTIAKQEWERPIDFRTCSLSRDFQLMIPAEIGISRTNWKDIKEVRKVKWEK